MSKATRAGIVPAEQAVSERHGIAAEDGARGIVNVDDDKRLSAGGDDRRARLFQSLKRGLGSDTRGGARAQFLV